MNKLMERVYADSEEKYVKTVMLYADSDDGHVYYDSTKKTKIPKDELLEIYTKGCTIFFQDEYFKPVSYKDNGSDAVVTVVSDSGNYSFYSEEHGA